MRSPASKTDPGDLLVAVFEETIRSASDRYHEEADALIHNLVSSTRHTALLSDPEGEGSAHENQIEAMADTVWEFCRRAVVGTVE